MKKYLLFILVLLVPFFVKAESKVKITEVELVEKDDSVEVIEEPTFEGLSIDFNLRFSEQDTGVEYKIKVKNDSNKDYEINDGKKYTAGDYIYYAIEVKDGSKIIKAGETKEVLLGIYYNKYVPLGEFKDRKYNESNKMTINLSNDEVINPYTSTLPIAIVIISLIAFITLIITHSKKKSMFISLLALIVIPLTIKALEKLTIDVNANVEIEQPCTRIILDSPGSFSKTEALREICVFFENTDETVNDYHVEGRRGVLDVTEPYTDVTGKVFFVPDLQANSFTDDSFVRVYKDGTKENLLVEITKDSFEIFGYNLDLETMKGYPIYEEGSFESYFLLGNSEEIDVNNIYVEASQDLTDLFEYEHSYDDYFGEGFINKNNPISYNLLFEYDDIHILLIEKYITGLWIDEEGKAKYHILEEIIYDQFPEAKKYGIRFSYREVEDEPYTYYLYWKALVPVQ